MCWIGKRPSQSVHSRVDHSLFDLLERPHFAGFGLSEQPFESVGPPLFRFQGALLFCAPLVP
jgi:hypothetical protein